MRLIRRRCRGPRCERHTACACYGEARLIRRRCLALLPSGLSRLRSLGRTGRTANADCIGDRGLWRCLVRDGPLRRENLAEIQFSESLYQPGSSSIPHRASNRNRPKATWARVLRSARKLRTIAFRSSRARSIRPKRARIPAMIMPVGGNGPGGTRPDVWHAGKMMRRVKR